MNDEIKALKIYTAEVAKELSEKLSKLNVKEASGSGTFSVIASTSSIDRDGESIDVNGWDLANYLLNPVVLWGHDYYSKESLIGAATNVRVENGQLLVDGVFAETEPGQYVRGLYDAGILKTVSVGFIVKERNGNMITKQELLELSFVPVPANPEALAIAKAIEAGKEFEKKFLKVRKSEEKPEGEKDEEPVKPDADKNAIGEDEKHVKMTQSGVDKLTADLAAIIKAHVIVVEDKKATEADIKAGRTISAKTRGLLQAAHDAAEAVKAPLKALLDSDSSNDEEDGKTVDVESIKSLMQSADNLIGEALKKFREAKGK